MRRRILATVLAALMALSLTACGSSNTSGNTAGDNTTGNNADTTDNTSDTADAGETGADSVIPPVEDLTDVDTSTIPGLEDGVLTVGMECAYAPYNWMQMDDSNGAVPISNVSGSYGWELEIVSSDWDGLTAAIQSGTMDANIAGQSMTADRLQEVDMAGPYFYATIVCVTTKDSPNASATSIQDLSGTCTAQTGTIWYDSCLPQIEEAEILPPAETAPAMIMQLQTGTADFICTDLPTAMGAVAKDDNLVILNFSGTDGDFQFATEEERAENVNIGISVEKGNTQLVEAMNTVLSAMDEEQFNALMDYAISIQPEI